MRQGNGTELLGADDPRSASIGVIHVAPNDDRKSVLAAIITQEKLGRKQVAVVLPTQNKAFQRPIDFDDLKSMRRKLQTQIVFIAPSGPGPAEFARQRRFPVYSSLDNYANALRDELQVENASKKGWLFGNSRQRPSQDLAPAANSSARAVNAPPQEEEEEVENERTRVMAPFAAGAAGALAANQAFGAQHPAASGDTSHDPGFNFQSMTPDAQGGGVGQGPRASISDDDWDSLSPATPASAGGVVPATPYTEAGGGPPDSVGSAARGGDVSDQSTMNIIELPRRGRATDKLPVTPPEAAANAPASASVAERRSRNSGKMAAVAAGTAGAGLAASGSASPPPSGAVVPRTAGGGNVPPPRRGGSGGGGSNPPKRGRARSWLIALALLLLTALLVCGGIAYAQPGILGPFKSVVPSAGQPSATVTITPASQLVQDSYVVRGVTGTPNASQREVAVRSVTGTGQAPAKTVNTTGRANTPGATATGRLTFTNGSTSIFTVASGTVIPSSSGADVVTDGPAVIPAASPANGTFGAVTISAHAAGVGTAGNIGAQAVNQSCCTAGGFVFVRNTAPFTGGQDKKNYNFVQQADIDGVVNPVRDGTIKQAQAALQGQLKPGEQLTTSVKCVPTITSSAPIGDRGTNVATVTVSYSVKCTATAYDKQAAQDLGQTLLQRRANTNPGAGYALTGAVQTQVSVQGADQQNVSLIVTAKGVWVYQFTEAQKQSLARLIIGKRVADAQTLLKSQKGVSNASIQASDSSLPTDPGLIAIVIQPVQGLGGQNGGTPTIGTPTVTGPTAPAGGGTPPAGNDGKGGTGVPSGS